VIDLRFTIVVKRFTVNGKFSQAATKFAEDPATFFGGETEPGCDSPTALSLCPKAKLQAPPLRYPGFPVELGGAGELHAAFLTESRTRGRW
jgi:hypothetical protein